MGSIRSVSELEVPQELEKGAQAASSGRREVQAKTIFDADKQYIVVDEDDAKSLNSEEYGLPRHGWLCMFSLFGLGLLEMRDWSSFCFDYMNCSNIFFGIATKLAFRQDVWIHDLNPIREFSE